MAFLGSLEIQGFRIFKHLQVKRLGRVNLIVGKNNVGKSSLLEALAIYARKEQKAIWELLASRDETRYVVVSEEADEPLALKHLFHGRAELDENVSKIVIGEVDSVENRLSITAGWYRSRSNNGSQQLQAVQAEEYDMVPPPLLAVAMQKGGQKAIIHRFEKESRRHLRPSRAEKMALNCLFLPANGLNEKEIGQLWDRISLRDLEKDVLSMLRIVAKDIERINLIGQGDNRIPIVRMKELSEPIPLRSLGEGMNRIFGIALGLVNAKDGLLLIDDVANGLHYSVQYQLWRLIFASAHHLNIQVFATTHSNDCILAFQEAALEHKHSEGMLIRLENRLGQIVPILFDEQRLGIATQQEIEVR